MTSSRVFFCILLMSVVSAAFAQDVLLSSPQPVSVGMSLQGNTFALDVQAATSAAVSVFCPIVPGLMSFSGLTEKIETSYDQKNRLLQLSLPPGKYRLTIRSF